MTLPSLQKPKGFDNENHLSLPMNKYLILSIFITILGFGIFVFVSNLEF